MRLGGVLCCWERCMCLSTPPWCTDEQINKRRPTHTVEYYAAMNRSEWTVRVF